MSSPYDALGNSPPVAPKPEKKPMAAEPKPEPKPKRLTRSKTFWVNLVACVGSVLAAITGSEVVADNPQVVAYGATALAVINLVLRFISKEPVKLG